VRLEVGADGVATLTLAKEPVNSLDTAAWAALAAALAALEARADVKALVLASGLARDVFSAGNDLGELYAPGTTRERYERFWIVQNDFLAALYSSRLATVAAVRGACPAGGCIIAMCCDASIMAEGPAATMGLNEVRLGIPVPKMWAAVMARRIGPAAAERLLLGGEMLSGPAAAAAGLVDRLVPAGELMAAARAAAAAGGALPGHARAATKLSLRGEFCDAWRAFARVEPDGAWPFLCKPETVRVLGAAMARLGGGGKKPAPASKL
jgi:3,2-trans-enoyl-CoA isomerase